MGGFQRGGGGGGGGARSPDPPKKSPKKGFLSILVRFPLKSEKTNKSAFHVGSSISETPFKWCFAGRLMMARL